MKNCFILLLAVLAILIQVNPSNSAKILGFFSTPSPSHMIVHNGLIYELANRGHEVTLVTILKPTGKLPENIRLVHIESETNDHQATIDKWMKKDGKSTFGDSVAFVQKTTESYGQMLTHPKYLALTNETFDLVIMGWFFNDFQIGVAQHFKAPLILSASMKPNYLLRSFVGTPQAVSYVPSSMLPLNGPMNFGERVLNFGAVIGEHVLAAVLERYLSRPNYEKYFPSDQYVSYDEARKNVALVLVSHHFSLGPPQPYLPGMVEVGGMHIKADPQPLPEAMKHWLDNATAGAIFFSLGSNAKSTQLTVETRDAIMRVFAKMSPIKVLWKWENDQLPNKADNVMIGKWMPQSDILAHPNLKVFISHCGLGSVNEAKYHGVPILGVPIFADQPSNLANIIAEGWGLGTELTDFNEDRFGDDLHRLFSNSSYGDTVKTMSNLFRDRPVHPLETAVYWAEYVIRHKGAQHLQSPAVHLNFIEYHSLDVIGLILVTVYVGIRVAKWVLCAVVRRCRSKLKRKTE